MRRAAQDYLKKWLGSEDRKPIVVRGARQTGKTWLARECARENHRQLVEINFERNPQARTLFTSNDPKQVLLNIESAYDVRIDPQHSFLFLDEVQVEPAILSKLRWFAEELPELPVMAAGSLLEFVLADHVFSMPVGRITYLHLEPFSFEEFLRARQKEKLCEWISQFHIGQDAPSEIHQQCMQYFKEYILVGGMPAAIASWIKHQSLEDMNRIQHDILATYRDDFSKYAGKIDINRLSEVFAAVPKMIGEKFVYRRVSAEEPSVQIKRALHLLTQARVCHKVQCNYGNGVPLAAENNEKIFKAIFIDVGLVSASLGLKLNALQNTQDISLVNRGGIAEQVVGQLLRTIEPFYIEPALYYWAREEKSASAEIDYLLNYNATIWPVEVKSGSTGSLKSLHLFAQLKHCAFAVRIDSRAPSVTSIEMKTHTGAISKYTLLSLPFYLVGQLYRLMAET